MDYDNDAYDALTMEYRSCSQQDLRALEKKVKALLALENRTVGRETAHAKAVLAARYHLHGNVLEKLGRHEAATVAFQEAADLYPVCGHYLLGVIESLCWSGREATALKQLKKHGTAALKDEGASAAASIIRLACNFREFGAGIPIKLIRHCFATIGAEATMQLSLDYKNVVRPRRKRRHRATR